MVIEIERIRHFYDSRILKSHWYYIFSTFYYSWHRFLGGLEKIACKLNLLFLLDPLENSSVKDDSLFEKDRKWLKLSILNDIKLFDSIHLSFSFHSRIF